MELKKLIKNTSYLATTKIIQFLVGVIRSKFIAILLGTVGMGVYSQLEFVAQKMGQFTLLSMNSGLVKQIAESRTHKNFEYVLKSSIKSYISIVAVITFASFIMFYLFSKELTVYLLGDLKYYNYFLVSLFSFPLLVLNSISYAVLQGFKEIKSISHGQLIIIAINFIFFIPLIYLVGLTGAVISITLSFLSAVIINHYIVTNKVFNKYFITIKSIIQTRTNKNNIKELLTFAGFGITSGVVIILSEIATRSIVINYLGIYKLGIYAPVISWGGLFQGFILPSINTYLFPRFSESKTNFEIVGILNDVIRLVTFLLIPLLFLSIPIRFQIIPLFYSNEFREAGNYLPWHFIGILIFMWMSSFTQVFAPTGRIKIFGLFIIVMYLMDIAVVAVLVPNFGLSGYMLKFIISPTIFLLIFIIYFKKQIHFKIDLKNQYLMIFALSIPLILLAIEHYLNIHYLFLLIIGIIFLALSYFFFTKEEKSVMTHKLEKYIKFIFRY